MAQMTDLKPITVQLRQIRQAIFDGIMDYYNMDEQDADDQREATEITQAIMKRVELSVLTDTVPA